jgi:hypothetical protein
VNAAGALDPGQWQPVLDLHAELFQPLDPGAGAVLLSKEAWDSGAGAALELRARAPGEGPALSATVMDAELVPWHGVGRANVDLVFVCRSGALDRLAGARADARLSLLKDLVHAGEVLVFVMKTKCNLVNAGWEEFLDGLGLAFMGACR